MLLEGKSAVIYGAGGAIGGAVARAFAGEGARVFLAGRTAGRLEAVAEQIRSAGGVADLISRGYVIGTPMAAMQLDDYLPPLTSAVRTAFLTWRAASRHMTRQGSGVMLAFGGEGRVAAFVASDRARTITAATVNVSGGALID